MDILITNVKFSVYTYSLYVYCILGIFMYFKIYSTELLLKTTILLFS